MQSDSRRDVCAWLTLTMFVRSRAVVALQAVDVSLHLYTAAIRKDTGDGLLILTIDPVVRQRSRELSLEASASTGGSPYAGSPR